MRFLLYAFGVSMTVSKPRRRSASTNTAVSRAAVARSTSKTSQTRPTMASIAVRPSAASQITVPTALSVCSVLSAGETMTASPSYTRQAALGFCSGYVSGTGDDLPHVRLRTKAEREARHRRRHRGGHVEHATEEARLGGEEQHVGEQPLERAPRGQRRGGVALGVTQEVDGGHVDRRVLPGLAELAPERRAVAAQ